MRDFFKLPRQLQLREGLKFFSVILGSAIFPYMGIYYVNYFGKFWTGILLMLTQIIGFLASLYGGHLSDSIGRKKVTDWGNFGVAIGYIIMTLANSPLGTYPFITYLGLLLAEMMSNFAAPAYSAMIIDLTDDDNRHFVYTMSYWLVNISVMLGSGIAGLFYDSYFFALLIGMTLIAIVTFIVMWLKFDETKPAHVTFDHGVGVMDSFKNYTQVFGDRIFLRYTLGALLGNVVWMQIDHYIPIHFKEAMTDTVIFGTVLTGAKMVSTIVFINTVMIVFLMTTINKRTSKLPLLKQYTIGNFMFVMGVFFTLSLNRFEWVIPMVVVYTLGEMISMPAGQVLRAQMMDENKVGSYSGFLSMVQPLGSIIAASMVSMSYFTGPIGVQLIFILAAVSGYILVLSAAKAKLKET